MATEYPGLCIGSFRAGEDMSAAQFRFVKLGATAGDVDLCDAATDKMIGVVQNDPKDNEPANVMITGISKVEVSRVAAAEAIAIGSAITTDAVGRADLADAATDYIAGYALDAADAVTAGRGAAIIRVLLLNQGLNT